MLINRGSASALEIFAAAIQDYRKRANYAPLSDLAPVLQKLQTRHDARTKEDPDFQRLLEDVAELKAQREKEVVSLNEAERHKSLLGIAA